MFENIKYYILDVSEINLVDLDEVLIKDPDRFRRSLDGLKCLIKIEGPPKEFLNNISSLDGPFSHSEIRTIVTNPQWA